MSDKPLCKLCGTSTDNTFNICESPVPICELCARDIFMQQAIWLSKQVVTRKPAGLHMDMAIIRKLSDKHSVSEVVTMINQAVKIIDQ